MNDIQQENVSTCQYLSCFEKILQNMICGMTCAKLCRSISYNFIVQMIPHHQAAVEMSRNLLRYTTFQPLQEIASNIIEEQTKSIQNMEKIMRNCGHLCNTCPDLSSYQQDMNVIMCTMFTEMKQARPSNNVNISFMREMIPHHEGAIAMSSHTLDYPICSSLKPILNAIITSQKKGVQAMESLLASCN